MVYVCFSLSAWRIVAILPKSLFEKNGKSTYFLWTTIACKNPVIHGFVYNFKHKINKIYSIYPHLQFKVQQPSSPISTAVPMQSQCPLLWPIKLFMIRELSLFYFTTVMYRFPLGRFEDTSELNIWLRYCSMKMDKKEDNHIVFLLFNLIM